MSKILENLKKLRRFLLSYNIFNYAAQLSYSLMLAILPLVMVFNWALGFLSTQTDVSVQVVEFVKEYLPDSLSDFLAPQLAHPNVNVDFSIASIIGNIALVFFIVYAAARLMRSIRIVTTNLCDMPEDRNFIKLWALAFRDLFITLIIISATVYIYVEARIILIDFLSTVINQSAARGAEIFWNRLLIVYMGVVAVLTLNWYLAKFPSRPFKYTHALPGTIFVVIGWEILFLIVNKINSFLNAEGAIAIVNGGLSITVTIYLISLVFVLGELLNYYLEENQLISKFVTKLKEKFKSKKVKQDEDVKQVERLCG